MKEADVPAQKVGEDERGSHGISAAENPIDLSYRPYITSERAIRQQDRFTSRSNAALPSDIAVETRRNGIGMMPGNLRPRMDQSAVVLLK